MSTIPLPSIPLGSIDANAIDMIIKAAEEKKNKGVVELLAVEMEMERALISGLTAKLAQLDKQKNELVKRMAPLNEKRTKLESLKDFIPPDQYEQAMTGINDLVSGVEMQIEHIDALSNQDLHVELFEHQQRFEEQKKQMHAYPVKLRIELSHAPVSDEQIMEASDLKSIKSVIKQSGILTKTKRLVLGIYGEMPNSNREILRSMFEFNDFYQAMPSDGKKIFNGIESHRVCAVVSWKYIRDTEGVRKACEAAGIPFIMTENSSKKHLVIEVANVFGLNLKEVK